MSSSTTSRRTRSTRRSTSSVANRELTVDSRPSDAIALALRTHSPLFVEETVLEKSRSGDDSAEAHGAERLRKWLEDADPDSLGKYKM